MNGRADRAKIVGLVRGMLSWILLGCGRLGRHHAGDAGAACELFEMNVSERKRKLQRHRCKREPTAPPPIGTNPTHRAKRASPRLEQSTVEPIRGNAFGNENITAKRKLAGLLPECNSSPPIPHSILKHRRRQQRRTSPVLTRRSASRALSAARSGSAR